MTRNFLHARATSLPPDSAGAVRYPGAPLADAFSIVLPHGTSHDVERLARAALGDPPSWLRVLLAFRDAAMVLFGVKTTAQAVIAPFHRRIVRSALQRAARRGWPGGMV